MYTIGTGNGPAHVIKLHRICIKWQHAFNLIIIMSHSLHVSITEPAVLGSSIGINNGLGVVSNPSLIMQSLNFVF